MSNFTVRPAIRKQMPLIPGLAGPSKSGKTYSALRLAMGLTNNGKVIMINTEGERGNQYADIFKYDTIDLTEPFSLKRYTEAIKTAQAEKPGAIIIDSVSHAHEGEGGMLDQHEKELDRLAGNDYQKRLKSTWQAWIKPKADEAEMINSIIRLDCHVILCFRAKEKIKIVKGKEPIDLGWQPIGSDRIHFETAFTLILPPHSKGKPDLEACDMREPFDKMVESKQIDEDLGHKLAEWAAKGKPLSGKEQKAMEVEPQHKEESPPPSSPNAPDKIQVFQNEITLIQSKAELTRYFQEFIKDRSLTKVDLDQATNLANEKHKALKK